MADVAAVKDTRQDVYCFSQVAVRAGSPLDWQMSRATEQVFLQAALRAEHSFSARSQERYEDVQSGVEIVLLNETRQLLYCIKQGASRDSSPLERQVE